MGAKKTGEVACEYINFLKLFKLFKNPNKCSILITYPNNRLEKYSVANKNIRPNPNSFAGSDFEHKLLI